MKLFTFFIATGFGQDAEEETTLAWTTTVQPTTELATTKETIQAELLSPVAAVAPLPNKDIFIVYDDLDLSSPESIGDQVLNAIADQLEIKTGTRSNLSTQVSFTLTIQLILSALARLDIGVKVDIEATLEAAGIDARVLTTTTGIRECPQGKL